MALAVDDNSIFGIEMATSPEPASPCSFQGRRYVIFYFGVSPYQFDTDLEGGGDCNVKRYFFRFDAGRQMTTDIKAGIGLSYDYEDWDFTGATGLIRIQPFSAPLQLNSVSNPSENGL